MKHQRPLLRTALAAALTPLLFTALLCTTSCKPDDDGPTGDDTNVTHDYVDLGLPSGILWATCNVGATVPEGLGDAFAWGETSAKDDYSWGSYAYCEGSDSTLTKYCSVSTQGYSDYTDALPSLEAADDAAAVRWGDDWRTPSQTEWQELIYNCAWEWTTLNGVEGFTVTSKANGNTLFLPAAGRHSGADGYGEGSHGFYWSATLYNTHPELAWCCVIASHEQNRRLTYYERSAGNSVRPVRGTSLIYVSTLTLSDVALTLPEGGTATLTVTASPIDARDKSVTWSSSDTSVAAVDNNGTVTAGTAGSATITVTANDGSGVTATCEVNVVQSIDGYEYVDLGLPSGLLWATYNVGATSPEGCGSYFAWGETTSKSRYVWATYQYCNGSDDTQTKYCNKENWGDGGYTDALTTLEAGDDAAAVNWGGRWRMPTKDEWQELIDKCTWTWTSQRGVPGYKVTSKANGNALFLPAVGHRDDASDDDGEIGYYWSSTLYLSYPYAAYYCYLASARHNATSRGYRYAGQSVRAVAQP